MLPADLPKCTWTACHQIATHPQIDNCGAVWADLCINHHKRWKQAWWKDHLTVKCWVAAQGGAKHAAERLLTFYKLPTEHRPDRPRSGRKPKTIPDTDIVYDINLDKR